VTDESAYVQRLPMRDFNRIRRQKKSLMQDGRWKDGLSPKHLDKHLGDIAEALVQIHFEREVPAYRFATRKMLEGRLREEGVTGPEQLDAWYGIVLTGGEDERLASWLHIWKAVGLEGIHSMLRSLDRLVENRVSPIASSQ
jgi:hypothetical protein